MSSRSYEPSLGIRRTATLISVLGPPAAKAILSVLPEAEVIEVARQLLTSHPVEPEEEAAVLKQFQQDWAEVERTLYVRDCLAASVGSEAADGLLAQLETSEMFAIQDDQVASAFEVLQHESPALIAAIVSQLNSVQAAKIVEKLVEPKRTLTLLKLAGQVDINEKLARRLVERLMEKVKQECSSQMSVGGPRRAAEILNELRAEAAEETLLAIEEEDPKLAGSIRELSFTFDDFISSPSSAMKQVCQSIDKSRLALALKGTTQQLRAQFLRNMSERSAEMLLDEIDTLGPARKSEVLLARKEVVEAARKLQEAGKITLSGSGEELII